MIKRLFVLLALALVLTGCSDPVRVEKANAIRRQSEAQFLATATAVAIERQEADVRIAATATAIADREAIIAATQAERINNEEAARQAVIYFSIAYVTVLLVAFSVCGLGAAVAAARKANLEARLVRIDRATRTWPILVDTKAGLLVDLETGERARLDSPNVPHPGRLIGSVQARVTGLLAQAGVEMAKSTKDGSAGSSLPAIAYSVPLLLDSNHWLPELKERRPENARQDVAGIDGTVAATLGSGTGGHRGRGKKAGTGREP